MSVAHISSSAVRGESKIYYPFLEFVDFEGAKLVPKNVISNWVTIVHSFRSHPQCARSRFAVGIPLTDFA